MLQESALAWAVPQPGCPETSGCSEARTSEVLAGLAAPPAARGLVQPRSPCFPQLGSGPARRGSHELCSFPASSLQFRVSRRALARLYGRVELRTRGGGDVFGHPLDVGLRQLTGGAGADEPGLLAGVAQELPADALGRRAECGDLR
jgi:hypothetical protein